MRRTCTVNGCNSAVINLATTVGSVSINFCAAASSDALKITMPNVLSPGSCVRPARSKSPDFAASCQVDLRSGTLGPVHTMFANANGWRGAPIAAPDAVQTGRLHKEGNKEGRPRAPVPFGLLPETPSAALQRLAGHLARLSRSTLRWAFSAVQRVCVHSVNRR